MEANNDSEEDNEKPKPKKITKDDNKKRLQKTTTDNEKRQRKTTTENDVKNDNEKR